MYFVKEFFVSLTKFMPKQDNSSSDITLVSFISTKIHRQPNSAETSSFSASITSSSDVDQTLNSSSILKSNYSLLESSVAKQIKRSVSFNSISIRKYEIVIAEHPGYFGGPPIGLGLGYTSEDSFEFSAYGFERKPRRSYAMEGVFHR